ncbi:PCI domain-containing protein [Coniophora puteana RWD-64-598 SS2]|uniref:Eukaryotic translation initiation factor 3 subunit M n=1 Tax=Coniophora puteana (strain RWD-64-598) TaxID=741705 RepID=A0A5M3MB43_CONPW|nr:PCI domain-containing protein [Coniophora puteana RWD-64-598 SS2]EIW76303.1 PCI domain-containing protein [Coniophora puteana RWD-64-598 SS2]
MSVERASAVIWGEGTHAEQVQELLDFTLRNRPEEEQTSIKSAYEEISKLPEGTPEESDVKYQKAVTFVIDQVKDLGEGTDLEIEGFFNLLIAHVFGHRLIQDDETTSEVKRILDIVSKSPSENNALKYRIMSNTFNHSPHSFAIRPLIYTELLKTATANGELNALRLTKDDVDRWLVDWDISDEEKSAFVKQLVDAYQTSGQQETAYAYNLRYVQSLPSSSPLRQEAAVSAIVMALGLPTVYDFDPLFKLDAVVAAKDHEIFPLFQIFLSGGLQEYTAWASSNGAVIEKYGLIASQLEHKIRLLTFSSLGFQYVGKELPYSEIASHLQIDVSEVEKWSIDVIRVRLLTGKLSQTTKTLRVHRATARTFEREQWEALEKRLLAWKAGLASVISTVASARHQNGGANANAGAGVAAQGAATNGVEAAAPEVAAH